MTDVKICYGKKVLNVGVPAKNLLDYVCMPDVPGVENEEETIIRALKNPIEMEPLEKLASPGQKIAIVSEKPQTENRVSALQSRIRNGAITTIRETKRKSKKLREKGEKPIAPIGKRSEASRKNFLSVALGITRLTTALHEW